MNIVYLTGAQRSTWNPNVSAMFGDPLSLLATDGSLPLLCLPIIPYFWSSWTAAGLSNAGRSSIQVNIVVASVDGHMADDQVRTSSKVAQGTPKWRSS